MDSDNDDGVDDDSGDDGDDDNNGGGGNQGENDGDDGCYGDGDNGDDVAMTVVIKMVMMVVMRLMIPMKKCQVFWQLPGILRKKMQPMMTGKSGEKRKRKKTQCPVNHLNNHMTENGTLYQVGGHGCVEKL